MTMRQTAAAAIDPDEFASWLTSLQPDLFRFAIRMTSVAPDAADLVQGTTVRALEKRRLFNGNAPNDLRRWLYRMMVNLHCDHVRRRGREVAGGRIDELPAVVEPMPVWATIDDAEVSAAVARLQPRLRTAYELYALDRCSYAKISSRLHIPVRTVASRIHRARSRLRETLIKDREAA
jgi:RNA polymerase sigma factor (sigma-70 family)